MNTFVERVIPLKEFKYANSQINVYFANKGQGLPLHEHLFNHATMCQVGSCLVRVKNKEFILTIDSQPLDLPANEPHEIEALEDNTVFVNVFAEGKY
jgi:quercetin dioxygenase-like cupin family protein